MLRFTRSSNPPGSFAQVFSGYGLVRLPRAPPAESALEHKNERCECDGDDGESTSSYGKRLRVHGRWAFVRRGDWSVALSAVWFHAAVHASLVDSVLGRIEGVPRPDPDLAGLRSICTPRGAARFNSTTR